jgi:formylmethanofuran dehydrogenase subunit E
MNICTYSYEEYIHLVKSFHGTLCARPANRGLSLIWSMKNLPEGEFLTLSVKHRSVCPIAVQILTPAPSATALSHRPTLAVCCDTL